MKSLKLLLALGVLAFGTNASAATINDSGIFDGVDVGGVDGLIIQETITGNSNPTTETAWANQYISGNAEYVIKTENITYYSTDVENAFAFELSSDEPDYFLVKNATERALFRNGADFDWGVFDASLFTIVEECKKNGTCTDNQLINLGGDYNFTISHVTEINGPGRTVVPIPPAVWLFGAGLLGLVGVARRGNPA